MREHHVAVGIDKPALKADQDAQAGADAALLLATTLSRRTTDRICRSRATSGGNSPSERFTTTLTKDSKVSSRL
jgi:hypothetical protein